MRHSQLLTVSAAAQVPSLHDMAAPLGMLSRATHVRRRRGRKGGVVEAEPQLLRGGSGVDDGSRATVLGKNGRG